MAPLEAPLLSPPPVGRGAAADKQFAFPPFRAYNHNVVVTWANCLVVGVADSIWSGTVLASYLYELMGRSNKFAGYVEAAQGVATLLVALPLGYLADRTSKARVIALGALVIPVAIGATAFAVVYGVAQHEEWSGANATAANRTAGGGEGGGREPMLCFWIFMGAMCLWGVEQAITNGPAQALYADSIRTGERSHYYTILFALYLAASMLGPLISIVMFSIHGNEWDLPSLRNIFLAGLAVEAVGMFTFMLFRDDCALEEESEAVRSTSSTAAPRATDAEEASGAEKLPEAPPDEPSPHVWLVPYILFASSLCFALGSGMTVKFFPLFFKNDCGLSPIGVQGVYAAMPPLMAAMSGVGTWVSKGLGRVQTMVAIKVVGVSLLVSMALLKDWVNPSGDHAESGSGEAPPPHIHVGRAVVMVIIYLVRTGLMNCTYPLEESILMDYVPKNTRARWKALDSVGVFGWCGSAAIGGYLADVNGYAFTFLITAAVQYLATALQASLIFIVPRREMREATATDAPSAVVTEDFSATIEPEASIQ